jgi:pimeloyl-ACP methyl ester carboxylesterase
MGEPQTLPEALLPAGVRASFVDNGNGLNMHVLEAGSADPGTPVILLLHGFPELAYSWRSLMVPLSEMGYRVIAPDQRGYGRTLGADHRFAADIAESHMFNLARDALGLVNALGIEQVDCLVGHDFGSPVAAWSALLRPDVYRSVVLMSAPFGGAPMLPNPGALPVAADVHEGLARLERPRKHYQWYYSTEPANNEMWKCEQGVHEFLRAYFHMKSADWPENHPEPLDGWNAAALARLPTYYVMDAAEDMAQTVIPHRPSADDVARCHWLPESAMLVYAQEYGRNGFQGGLNWYRAATTGRFTSAMQLFSGKTINVPACFIAGQSDWGVYQKPGELLRMRERVCSDFRGQHLVPDAGHWVQQEQPEQTLRHLEQFLGELD